ncbi:MAG TPA: arginase family protein, partial [Negativicutes bacterium]
MGKNISLIGVPMWQGQSKYGVNWGPDVLRSVGLVEFLKLSDNNIVDLGNIPVGTTGSYKQGTNIKNVKLVAAANRRLAESVAEVV